MAWYDGFLDRIWNWFKPRVGSSVDNLLGLAPDGSTQFDYSIRNNNEQAQIDRDWQEKMFNLSNFWNSPEHQMKLMRYAGLNPALMYGQMSDLSASVPSGAQASSPSGSAGRVDSLLGLGLDAGMMPAQINLMNAQAEEIRSRIPLNQQRTVNLGAQYNDILASVKQRLADIALKGSQVQLNDEQRKNISFDQMYKTNQLAIDYRRLENENALTSVQVKNIEANTRELLARAGVEERSLQEMIYTFSIRKAGLEKQNLLTDALIAQANATKAKLEKEGLRIDQLMDIDSPRAINSQSWADDMSGKNGKINQVGANITYQFVNTLERLGSFFK